MLTKSIQRTLSYLLFSLNLWSCVVANSAQFTSKLHETTPQDCTYFLPDAQLAEAPVVSYDAAQLMDSFLTYYFAPWENPFQFFSIEELQKRLPKKAKKMLKRPGWGPNKHPLSTYSIAVILCNMNLATFPNYQQPAILERSTMLRGVPCDKPSFTDWVSAGEGYPFDNWQGTTLPANTPLYILHSSQDQAWYFVLTGNRSYGWVQRKDVACVTPAFIAQWKTGKYVTPLRDEVMVKDNVFAPLARVGQLMPLVDAPGDEANHQVLTVVTQPDGYAATQVCTVAKADTAVMPLLATPSNMALLADNLMGQPFGWGGMEGYRDCSGLLQDIFLAFGIWLPRNSTAQAKAGTFISLEDLNAQQKEALLKKQGVPFFSLIWGPGYTALYIGERAGKPYVYDDIWGLRTKSMFSKEGRAVIGKVAIMPIDFGKGYSNIKYTLLNKAKGLILLNNRLVKPYEALKALHEENF